MRAKRTFRPQQLWPSCAIRSFHLSSTLRAVHKTHKRRYATKHNINKQQLVTNNNNKSSTYIMKLYIANLTCSLAAQIVAHEVGISPDIYHVNVRQGHVFRDRDGKDKDFYAITPQGYVPQLVVCRVVAAAFFGAAAVVSVVLLSCL